MQCYNAPVVDSCSVYAKFWQKPLCLSKMEKKRGTMAGLFSLLFVTQKVF